MTDTGGTALCTDTDTVAVTKGLFVMAFSNCGSNVFGGLTQLYLGIQVGGDPEMTPRQPLYSVPFAKGLFNGILSSGATSYLWVPGSTLIKELSGDTTRWDLVYGGARVWSGTDVGPKTVRFPITIPGVLYGQPVRVTAVRVYYRCLSGALNYITGTYLDKNTDADSGVSLVTDGTDRISNTATSYTLNTDSLYNTLSSSEGILALRLSLNFVDNVNYIQITGFRLTLDTNL